MLLAYTLKAIYEIKKFKQKENYHALELKLQY